MLLSRFLFILLLCFLPYPLDVNGQIRFEGQVHYTATAGNLGEVTGGGAGNILVGATAPLIKSGVVHGFVKAGYNDYGGLKGFGVLSSLTFKASGVPFIGGIRVYDGGRRLFFEVGLGCEFKRGHVAFDVENEEVSQTAFLGSVGAGMFLWRGVGFAGSYNVSQDSWKYGNVGLVYRFGG